jgi:hypothetical protein
MKKVLFLLLFFPLVGFGQDKSFELGVLFGGSLNSSNYSDANEKTLQPLGGLVAQYNFTKRFSIKSTPRYHIKGYSEIPQTSNVLSKRQTDLHYLILPLLAQINFNKNRWRFFCNTGFYLGYLIKATLKETYRIKSPATFSPSGAFNSPDFGITLAIGASFRINERIKIFLEPSWENGINEITILSNNTTEGTLKSITTSLGLTYVFPLRKKTFNGTAELPCADYNNEVDHNKKEKKKSKWRLVLYKDGEKVIGDKKRSKTKRGKSRLFKKKN